MKKRSKFLALLLTGAMLAGTFTGSRMASEAEGDTQVLNMRVASFGNNYDVQDMGWRWMMGDCYEGLYRNVADADGEHFILAGAESVDISDDNLVYTFHLRPNAKWSDGQPVTAHDYEYGWKRLLNPEYGYSYASFIFNVVGAEEYYKGEGSVDDVMAKAIDDYTFEVTLKIPDATFESKLVATPLYPTRQDIAEAAGDQWGKDWTLCVYNGPYCMSELVEDNKMVWTRNEEYWDAENTHLDAVNWYQVGEDSTAATMFDNGELDILQTTGDYTIKYRGEAENGDVQVVTYDYPGTVYFAYNWLTGGTDNMMSNVKIRKALNYSLNREEMISAVYGRYKPAYGFIAPAITFEGEPYRNQKEEPIKTEYDEYVGNPEKLQALFKEGLAELGIEKDLSEVTITYLSSGSTMEAQTEREYIQQMWQQMLGIQVNLSTFGDGALLKVEREAGNYDVMSSGWWSDYNDPLDYLDVFYGNVYATTGGYADPEYDAMLDSLDGEADMAKRLEIYEKAENYLLDEQCALIPIYYTTKEVFLQNWVKDYRTSSFGASSELYITRIEGRGN